MYKKILILLICCSPIFASRPLTTDDIYTVEPEKFCIEIGYEFIENSNSIGFSLTHGITKNLDFCIFLPFSLNNISKMSFERNVGNLEIATKFFIVEEKKNLPGFSLVLFSNLGTSEYYLTSILSKTINKINVHLNYSYTAAAKIINDIIYSGAIEFPVNEKLCIVSEIINTKENVNDEKNCYLEIAIGGKLQISETLIFDFGTALVGLDEPQQELKITSGLTYEF